MITETRLNALQKLFQLGQSPWYDNIEREMLEDGSFKKLVDEGLRGVTTNPTIFEKAINSSNAYDEPIRLLLKKGLNPEEIFDELTIRDVSMAAERLAGIFTASLGLDGYVSIEVLPCYANNPRKTIEYAKSIYKRINKPNIMIKVPGTEKGCEAIRELISSGISVNATLLFSLKQYLNIAKAYIDGIARRLKNDMPVYNVTSVASIFVSRIDTKVDVILSELLKKKIDPPKISLIKALIGKVAVYNSKIIYRQFKELFSSKNFEALKSKGAKIQRLLWASTGTKNPSYSDVKYVEELIGEFTVNTLPHETFLAFLDHGRVVSNIERDVQKAAEDLAKLNGLGIDLDEVCDDLQIEGIEAFQRSSDKLIESIKGKCKAFSRS